tara:strand:- start:115 stop:522 length:408 start_codon:yes stop_codon:yes gene_type:complete
MNRLEELKRRKLVSQDLKIVEDLFGIHFLVSVQTQTQIKANSKYEKFLINKNVIKTFESKPPSLDITPFKLVASDYLIRLHDSLSGEWFGVKNYEEFVKACVNCGWVGLSLYSVSGDKLYSLYEDEYAWQYYINE